VAKHIGIVACSSEGAALCYRTICLEASDIMGEHAHPEISMHTHPLSEYMQFIEMGNWDGVAELMASSSHKLERVGAEFLICPDNTIHQAFKKVVVSSSLPWLHIAEEVVLEATKKRYRSLAILGTRYLMEGPVYPEKLIEKNLKYAIPNFEERTQINRIIFEELTYGEFKDESRTYFVRVIERLNSEGCDAVVLGCTEIPLLITDKDSPVPVLDSTRLLARAALRTSLHQ